MHLVISPQGQVCCIYGESIDLTTLGELAIRRASFVEPNSRGRWLADLTPIKGPLLGSFSSRSQALFAEEQWLLEHWLPPVGGPVESRR
jgi:hypothetical protein